MTFLNLVNNVLRRLREPAVADVNADDYTALIGAFVNDARDQVESAWDWSQLRSVVTETTVASTNTMSITGFSDKSKLLQVVNDTANTPIDYRTRAWFEQKLYLTNGTVLEGQPRYYTFNGVDSNGDAQVLLYPTPDGAYDIRWDSALRGVELVNNTDETPIPHLPIIHLALAMAARERGETGGTTVQEYFLNAERYLRDAISFDAARHPEETVWYY